MRVRGAAAIVTGGASGLGLATARRLIDQGAKVTVVDREVGDGGHELEGSARLVRADVTCADDIERAVEAAAADGPLRFLVHCAGRGSDRLRIVGRDHAPGPLDGFAEVVHTNLVGTYNVLRLAAAAMSRNEPVGDCRGSCVLTASIAAFEGQVGQTSYSASKAGVHAMTLVAARDLARYGIRVNTIAPGTFDTPMVGRMRPELREGLVRAIPYPGRLGEPGEFARLAVEMLENDYLNGETIRLDAAMRMGAR